VVESPLIGVVSGVVISLLALIVGNAIVSRRLSDFPASARVGIAGLIGFGVIGTLVFLIGLVSTRWLPLGGVLILAAICAFLGKKSSLSLRVALPSSMLPRIILLAVAVLLLLRVPAALNPSFGWDWDSISHQLAMAKLWIEHGRVDFIPFMHQSNIPATANMLYMLVLPYGGQFGAKVLGIFCVVYALLAVGGLTERRYARNSGWWAALAVVCVPVVLWEVGTAYVDVIHGSAFAISALFAAMWIEEREEKRYLFLSALFMGMALATKYTALQSGAALGIAMVVVAAGMRTGASGLRGALIVGLVGLSLASPWYIRNVVNTGNPVYPFFYSVFGGSNWNEANADAYSAEQQSFGIGQTAVGKDPSLMPGSVVALALRPDLQINQGTPFGAVGPLFLLGLLWWPLAGLRGSRAVEKVLLGTALITLITWFALTQQSRYIVSLVLMCAPLLGGAIVRLPLGALPATAVALQAAFTTFLFSSLPLGIVNKEEALRSGFDFYPETERLNEIGKSERVYVALFDEVRGYYLDVPYFWANPGHHTMLPYEDYDSARDLIDGLKSLGVTHVSLSLGFLGVQGAELANAYFDPTFTDFKLSEEFRILLIMAHREGLLDTVEVFRRPDGSVSSFLFRIR